MSNPLFDQYGRQNNVIQQFNQFRNSFRGDPKAQVQQLLNSGRITQEQYNQAVKMAQNLQRMLGVK